MSDADIFILQAYYYFQQNTIILAIPIACFQLFFIKSLVSIGEERRQKERRCSNFCSYYISVFALMFLGIVQLLAYETALKHTVTYEAHRIIGEPEPCICKPTKSALGLPYQFNGDNQENYFEVERNLTDSLSYKDERKKLGLPGNPMDEVKKNYLKDNNYEFIKYYTGPGDTENTMVRQHSNPSVDPRNEKTWPYKEYSGWENEFQKVTPPYDGRPKKAMIIAGWRLGFEFVSSLFERHPDVFYLYEPFTVAMLLKDKFIVPKPNGHDYGKKHRVVKNIFNEYFSDCIIPRYDRYKYWKRDNQLLWQGKNCSEDNMCDRHHDFKFRTQPICNEDFLQLGTDPRIIHENCPLNEEKLVMLEKLCRGDKARVIKGNNINSILTDIPMKFKFDPDFHIVIWIRDPRSMVAGKWRSGGKENYKPGKIDQDCQAWKDYMTAAAYYADKWKMKIRFVRYEDFVNDPDYQAKELFHFLGLDFPESLSEFFYQETHMGYGPTPHHPYIQLNDSYMYDFSPLRHAPFGPYRYLTELSWEEINEIQNLDNCRQVMEFFGYEKLTEMSHQYYKKDYEYNWYVASKFYGLEGAIYDFHWDMRPGLMPIRLLAGRSQRANKDPEFLIEWNAKIWGWDMDSLK